MATSRFRLHELAGQELNKQELDTLRSKAIQVIDDNLQGYRDVEVDDKGRLSLSNIRLKEENKTQQILSLLIAQKAETEALMGRSIEPERITTPSDTSDRKILQEAVARGLIHSSQLDQTKSAFRGKGNISVDDLSDKFITDIFQIGDGYDHKTGAAHNYQIKESGHDLDHNLYPEAANSVDNVYQQGRRENKVTAASAKEDPVNSKYRSIVAERARAVKMIRDQYAEGYKDPAFDSNAEELDIYGSALDDLIKDIRDNRSSAKERSQNYLK